MNRPPIFFLITRSFWIFLGTVALMLEQGEPVLRAIAQLVVTLRGAGDVAALTEWLQAVAPIITLALMLQQRAGAARPYTVKPSAETLK